jgi:hypothetical protein
LLKPGLKSSMIPPLEVQYIDFLIWTGVIHRKLLIGMINIMFNVCTDNILTKNKSEKKL